MVRMLVVPQQELVRSWVQIQKLELLVGLGELVEFAKFVVCAKIVEKVVVLAPEALY